ncbi:MAG: hypothetical protein M0R80_03160 [Proteobacteria bacterium]|jgi:hypothetical protein|nr:hypothetical protein [Pseudomonadota bacterium]
MTILAKEVEIIPIQENLAGELGKEIYYECAFCGKRMAVPTFSGNLCDKLSGENYYCGFCLRHGFNTRNNKNVLLLTFRNVFNHYYQERYVNPIVVTKKMYLAEIKEYVTAHIQTGLLNPVFYYDPSSFLWFVDFSRVGRGNKKLKVNDVLKTVVNILACFNLKNNITSFSICTFYEKYETAIRKFYATRYRPADKRILSPSVITTNQHDYGPFSPELFTPNIY